MRTRIDRTLRIATLVFGILALIVLTRAPVKGQIPTRATGYVVTATDWNQLVNALNAMTGTITPFAGSAAPTGYLLCDGTAVNRTTYAALFAVAGTTYGSGNGSTTFNVPDLRQRFPLGQAASGTGSTLGGTGGAIDHTHSVPGLSVPGLSVPALSVPRLGWGGAFGGGTTSSDGAHTHTYSGTTSQGNDTATITGGGATTQSLVHTHTYSGTTSSDGAHTHTVGGQTDSDVTGTGTTGGGTTGTGTSGATNPPYLAVQYIIKT